MTRTVSTLHKRIGSITISEMKPKYQNVNGKLVKLCLNGCGKPIPLGNRKYCSLECSNEFFAKHNQRGMAELVFKRQNGICQKCGWKNPSYPKSPNFENFRINSKTVDWKAYKIEKEKHEQALIEFNTLEKRDFVADHIIPIALNGAEFDLDNIQLLCELCNKIKTREDMKKIAKKRRETKRSCLVNNYEVEGFSHVFQSAMLTSLDVFIPIENSEVFSPNV